MNFASKMIAFLWLVLLVGTACGEHIQLKKEAKFCDNCMARPMGYLAGKRADASDMFTAPTRSRWVQLRWPRARNLYPEIVSNVPDKSDNPLDFVMATDTF